MKYLARGSPLMSILYTLFSLGNLCFFLKESTSDRILMELSKSINLKRISSINSFLSSVDKLGDLLVVRDGQIIKTIDVVAYENVDKQTFGDIVDKIISNFITL